VKSLELIVTTLAIGLTACGNNPAEFQTTIPKVFHGDWALLKTNCSKINKYDILSIDKNKISNENINFDIEHITVIDQKNLKIKMIKSWRFKGKNAITSMNISMSSVNDGKNLSMKTDELDGIRFEKPRVDVYVKCDS
jgi:hypothetical protein